MPDRANCSPTRRGDEPLEVFHRQGPIVVFIGRGCAVSVTALIVAVDVADRAQPLCQRSVDASEESVGVQNYDRFACAAPIQTMQLDPVDVDETGFRFDV